MGVNFQTMNLDERPANGNSFTAGNHVLTIEEASVVKSSKDSTMISLVLAPAGHDKFKLYHNLVLLDKNGLPVQFAWWALGMMFNAIGEAPAGDISQDKTGLKILCKFLEGKTFASDVESYEYNDKERFKLSDPDTYSRAFEVENRDITSDDLPFDNPANADDIEVTEDDF